MQYGRPSCKSSSRCRSSAPKPRKQSGTTTLHLLFVHSSSDINLGCAQDNLQPPQTRIHFYQARLLPRLVLCTAAYRKKMMHIKGVPRWQADECMWIAHSTSACACDMCIRLRSFPHLSSALRLLRQLSNENRGSSPACCYE